MEGKLEETDLLRRYPSLALERYTQRRKLHDKIVKLESGLRNF